MTEKMTTRWTHLTIGDLTREPQLREFSRRQIEYAIREHGIQPIGRAGIIRLFSSNQICLIESALRKTSRSRA